MEQTPQELDDKVDRLVGKISLWTSLLLSVAVTIWYAMANPPDSEELKRMRLFFKDNAIEVGEFLRLSYEDKEQKAAKATHPFYQNYMKASEVEKGKIRKIYHESIDYTPYQYWFNMFGLWMISFSTFWFIGLMFQGVVNLVRQKQPQ
ncbi:hypothetical protein [Nitrospina watsonii]|uniref:Uncharacterized protein n=1 Tax=Nitrospina watsonii TaxID=1323948 RepID=A0ABM9HBQ5_9BACT|nr:hypothetical protein [Nitrospina watsonii]CAI2717651.1 conserved protein of unknown function [Nitrospina watsonii]